MKVLLEPGVWLFGWPAVCEGDPPRTLDESEAYDFDNIEQARKALKEARVYRPFENAQIVDDFI